MKASAHLQTIFFFSLLFLVQPASAQLGFDLAIKKPAPYDNRELKAEKSGRKKFNTPRRVFQNTFTHFNYFFNANNKLNEVVARAKETYKDDYARLLPFYNYDLSATAQDKDELDSVIYKSKTGILLHDLRNDWIDDLYLLWGQAYYLQEQYDSAYQMFQFINYAFADKEKDGYYKYIGSNLDGTAANRISSSEKLKLPKGLIADLPSRNVALLWEVRALIGSNAMVEAGSLLAALRNDPAFPDRLQSDLDEVHALWFYKQERWDSAAFHLKGALAKAATAQERARWEYLVAQLFVKSMQPEDAKPFYEKAITHTIDPVLELYARLNLIRINKEGGENYIDQNIAALLKMAKRDKYVDYRDAIYYMAGEMELERKNYESAQKYFLLAAKYKGEDASTAGRGFLQLAELYFTQKNYRRAAQFYDSVQVENMPTETAQQVSERKDVLAGLVTQMLVVDRQDSLQRLAALPEKQRDDYLKKLARQLRRQRGLSEESTTASTNPAAADLPSRKGEAADAFNSGNTKGEWYFYNENTRAQGLAAFKRIWGKRPNVDNWRRYTDVVADLQNTSPDNTRGNPAELLVNEEELFSYDGLLKNIPLTTEAKQQSNDSIAASLFTSGRIYTDRIEDYTSAIATYEELRKRFPSFSSTEDVLFQLYFSYLKTGNSAKAAEMKALLAQQYPDGRYAGIAKTGKDATIDTTDKLATKAYEGVYDLFLEGRFAEAKEAKQDADSLYGTSGWAPQLLYIEAVYYVKQGQDSLAKEVLNELIQQAGDSPLAEKATTMLDVLNRRREIEDELRALQLDHPAEEEKKIVVASVPKPEAEKKPEVKTEPQITEDPTPEAVTKTARMASDSAAVKNNGLQNKNKEVRRDTLAIKPAALPNRPKIYTYDPTATHLVVVLLKKIDVVFGNEAKNAFARYNREKFYNRTFELNVIPLNEDVKLLAIGDFANIQDAVDYLQKAKPSAATEIVPWLKSDKYSFTIISGANLLLLQETKDVPAYETFLDKNLPVKF